MSLRCYLNGVEIDESRVLLPLNQGIGENADGTSARSGIIFDDPAGDLDLSGWTTFYIEEDDCTPSRLFTGFVISRTISRGPYASGPSRQWNCNLLDLNEYVELQRLQGNRDDAQRPSETGSERLDWLMTTPDFDGVIFDNGEVIANAWTYDESDYRGKVGAEVLRDIVSASGVGRWTWFIYWDETAAAGEEKSLFYNDVNAAVRESDIRISNVISDQDGDTVYPFIDAEMEREPGEQYGGVYVIYTGGRIYRTNPTTIATMGLVRDGLYESARLINAETANRHAATYLDWHAGEVDTVTCAIQLPKERVNHLRAGDRVQVRFSHLPGYESFVWTRVATRTIVGLSADRSTYTLALVLSLHGILQRGGGGDPGDFPLPQPQAAHFYEATVTDTVATSGSDTPTYATITADLDPTTDYNWFAEITDSSGVVGSTSFVSALLKDNLGAEYVHSDWSPAGSVSPSHSGTFTSDAAPDNPVTFGAIVIHNDTNPASATVHFYMDPDGWQSPGDPLPEPGQRVGPETVTMSGADGTTEFPFANESLQVFVDNTDQTTKITTYDGAAGTFTLAFTPTPTETVVVYYQGR